MLCYVVYMYIDIYIYIHIFRERERDCWRRLPILYPRQVAAVVAAAVGAELRHALTPGIATKCGLGGAVPLICQ